jgi:hypothetical protein
MENVLYLLNIITLNSVYSALLWVCGFIFFYRLLLSFTYKTKPVYVKAVKRFGMYPCIKIRLGGNLKLITQITSTCKLLLLGVCFVFSASGSVAHLRVSYNFPFSEYGLQLTQVSF